MLAKDMLSRSIYRTLRCSYEKSYPPRLHISRPQLLQHSLRHGPHRSSLQRSFTTRRQDGFGHRARMLLRNHPVAVPFATAGILFGMGAFLFIIYKYVYDIAPINEKFPEPVANKLRRALWFTNIEPAPQKALDNYQEAIKIAQQHGMHPFSAEVLGIKLKIAGLLELFGETAKSIEVLDIIRRECQEFLDDKGSELNPSERIRILAMTVKTSMKIGELFGSDSMQDMPEAEKNLTQGVEIVLREEKRRQEQGLQPDEESEWLEGQEVGAVFEQLANHYEVESKHYLAAPLYLRALMLSPKSCHAALLMNNLAQSLAQTKPDSGVDFESTRHRFIENARTWAQKSIETAAQIKPPERNEECDMSCAVATHNLGEFAEMQGRYDEAKRLYVEAESLAKAVSFNEGVTHAQDALRRVEKLQRS